MTCGAHRKERQMQNEQLVKLRKKAAQIRRLIIEGVYNAGSGHPGGSLSVADILAYLYFYKMNVSPDRAGDPDRDRFVLSKGHASPALYAALALKGYFPVKEIKTLRKLGSRLQGHPDMHTVPGVDMSTGSLGQGFSAACGMAKAAKITGRDYKVYTVIGDGESQEGEIWEAAMFASHYKLGNLVAFLDFNRLQIDGDVRDVMDPTPLDEKFRAFGWDVLTVDGHDIEQIDNAVCSATGERPLMIICNTVKGKGVSYMENAVGWHGKAPKQPEYEIAVKELDAALEEFAEVE